MMRSFIGVNDLNIVEWIGESDLSGIYSGRVFPYVAGVSVGMLYENGKAKKSLTCCIGELSKKRELQARSGVVVNGVEMQTDKESIAAMDQYATESMMNGLTVVHWEKADGTFHDWPIADFKKLFSEITKYVNECFGRQSQLLDEINAAPNPETVDISTGWPSKTITFI